MLYKIDASNYIQATTDIADYVMQEKYGHDYEKYIVEENKTISFTEEGQKIFEDTLEQIEYFLGLANIVHEERGKKTTPWSWEENNGK